MEKKEIEELRNRVLCAAVLENGGWAIDLKESTRRAMKYRRGNEIVIVIQKVVRAALLWTLYPLIISQFS